ncbi:MAG: beta-mannosidase [Saprospirales bacterium]|nr:beta-mannosidase [Saprospirales bacterium]MBK8920105.1 beta-mannosidase [Saprospirales bacterium]
MLSFKAQRFVWLVVIGLTGCLSGLLFGQSQPAASDPLATKKTRALFANLYQMAGQKILFGHQDDLAYGVYWKQEAGRSDVQETCGSYPAVFGWDLGSRFGPGQMANIDSVRFYDMKQLMRDAYGMGGVNTLSWHLDNLVSGGNAWDTTAAVRELLPGGKHHDLLLQQLDGMAELFRSLKTRGLFKSPIPVIFRPWHEHTGHWFWWGSKSCTPEEYKALFRFTVDYLRNIKGIHNVLYAYSPDVFEDKEHYLLNYPGDEYVDIFGLDYYYRPHNLDSIRADLPRKLALLSDLAAEHRKIPAFTETGFEAIPSENWWTQMLLSQVQTARIAYLLVWRNANNASKPGHYYAPFPGQRSAKDFIAFSRSDLMLFQDKLPNLYKKPKPVKVKPERTAASRLY